MNWVGPSLFPWFLLYSHWGPKSVTCRCWVFSCPAPRHPSVWSLWPQRTMVTRASHRGGLSLLRSTGSRHAGFSSCGMWNLPGLGLELVSPALAGGFLTTAPPGKPTTILFLTWSWSLLFPGSFCLFSFKIYYSGPHLWAFKKCYKELPLIRLGYTLSQSIGGLMKWKQIASGRECKTLARIGVTQVVKFVFWFYSDMRGEGLERIILWQKKP